MEKQVLYERLKKHNLLKIVDIIDNIGAKDLREPVVTLLTKSLDAQESLTMLDFKAFEAAKHELSGEDVWKSLSTQVYGAFFKVADLVNAISKETTPPEDKDLDDDAFDMAFAELDEGLKPGKWTPPGDQYGKELDDLLEAYLGEESDWVNGNQDFHQKIGTIAWHVSHILKAEISQFNQRIAMEAVLTDRWNLLNELQETRHKLEKGIGALIAGVCALFAPVRKEEVVPGYQTELASSLQLRSYLIELNQHVGSVCDDMKEAPKDTWKVYADKVYHEVELTVFGPVFGWMRPLDKRTMVDLRNRFHELLHDENTSPRTYYEICENTRRFLEALNVINNREILVEHDHEALHLSLLYIESIDLTNKSDDIIHKTLNAVGSAAGRDPVLDKAAVAFKNDLTEQALQYLIEQVHRVLASLNQ